MSNSTEIVERITIDMVYNDNNTKVISHKLVLFGSHSIKEQYIENSADLVAVIENILKENK